MKKGSKLISWGTRPTERRAGGSRVHVVAEHPHLPGVARTRPPTIEIRVVLPAPLGPSSARSRRLDVEVDALEGRPKRPRTVLGSLLRDPRPPASAMAPPILTPGCDGRTLSCVSPAPVPAFLINHPGAAGGGTGAWRPPGWPRRPRQRKRAGARGPRARAAQQHAADHLGEAAEGVHERDRPEPARMRGWAS